MSDTSLFLSLDQVAKMLGVSTRTVLRLIDDKQIDAFKIGRKWKFEQAAVDRFIEQQKAEGGHRETKQKEVEPVA